MTALQQTPPNSVVGATATTVKHCLASVEFMGSYSSATLAQASLPSYLATAHDWN